MKHGLSMDLPDDISCPAEDGHLNFHELEQYPQINQENNKRIEDRFDLNPIGVKYVEELQQIMATAPNLDSQKVWLFTKVAAAYDLGVQSWILGHAIKQIEDHFLKPSESNKMDTRFHQWIYIIRSFQGCDVNFDADLFVNQALEKYIASFKELNHLDIKKKLKEENHDFSFNRPKVTIDRLRIVKLSKCMDLKRNFIEEQNCLEFLRLYSNDQQLHKDWCENCNKEKYSDDDRV
jgi:hypothetical protein